MLKKFILSMTLGIIVATLPNISLAYYNDTEIGFPGYNKPYTIFVTQGNDHRHMKDAKGLGIGNTFNDLLYAYGTVYNGGFISDAEKVKTTYGYGHIKKGEKRVFGSETKVVSIPDQYGRRMQYLITNNNNKIIAMMFSPSTRYKIDEWVDSSGVATLDIIQ